MTELPDAPPVIADQVTKTFGEGEASTLAVRGASCAFRANELTLLTGPSGSGKTTLISMLAGLLHPSSGKVVLCGEQIERLSRAAVARLRRRHLGFVFQSYNLFPALSALDNVVEVLVLKGMARRTAVAQASEVLARVGLEHRLHHRPGQLSCGQQQRVAVARALAGTPSVIIGDEVTASLDTEAAYGVMRLLRSYVAPGRAVIIVTHDERMRAYADRLLEMQDGVITADVTLPQPSTQVR